MHNKASPLEETIKCLIKRHKKEPGCELLIQAQVFLMNGNKKMAIVNSREFLRKAFCLTHAEQSTLRNAIRSEKKSLFDQVFCSETLVKIISFLFRYHSEILTCSEAIAARIQRCSIKYGLGLYENFNNKRIIKATGI